jgi:1-acyl-sn-glycerol-3-phosphate acyltransferase
MVGGPMPRWLRILLTTWSFFLFFFGSPLLPLIVFPWVRLTSRDLDHYRTRCTHLIHKGMRLFTWTVGFYGLVRAPRDVKLPEGVDPTQPYVLISNHPSLIDIVLSLGWFDGLTCLTKGSWKHSAALGLLLRSTHYLAGPTGDDDADVHGAIVQHLKNGHPVMIFPEGTRSLADRLHRFRRGAVEAAFQAGVPLVPMYIEVTTPYLMKGVPFWKVPARTPEYSAEFFEVIDPRTETRDPRTVNQALQEQYKARFARTVAARAAAAGTLAPDAAR